MRPRSGLGSPPRRWSRRGVRATSGLPRPLADRRTSQASRLPWFGWQGPAERRGDGGSSRRSPSIATVGAAGTVDGQAAAGGLGDPFFPDQGNGGYDVHAYHLRLRVHPDRDLLQGTVRIRATATEDLSSFSLDLRGLDVIGVRVDGEPVRAFARGAETDPGATSDRRRAAVHGRRPLSRPAPADHRSRRVEGGLDQHRRRQRGGRRAARRADLVPGQRRPDRQGHVRVQAHACRGR